MTRTTLFRPATPETHGDTLVWPPPDQLFALLDSNRRLIADHAGRLLDVPLADCRRATRAALAGDADAPLIVTGHQPDFLHAGVWAKLVVADRWARAAGGQALNLVVDQDTPKQTALPVPVFTGEVLTGVRNLPWLAAGGIRPFEFLPPVTQEECSDFEAAVQDSMGGRYGQTLMPRFFQGYCGPVSTANWVARMVSGRRAVESALDVRISDWRVGQVWGGPLLGVLLAEAARFAAVHNEVLHAYRAAHGLRSRVRPVPDMHCRDDRCELPLWLCTADGPRRTLYLRRQDDTVEFLADNVLIHACPKSSLCSWDRLQQELERLHPWQVRPKALALTLWARLLLADVFIHGMGGWRYDQITDEICRHFLGLEPPGMVCVTATLHLDLPGLPAAAVVPWDDVVSRAQRRLRDLYHNPQRLIAGPDVATLCAARAEAVKLARQLRRQEPGNHLRRRQVFLDIRDLNSRIAATRPWLADALRAELAAARGQAALADFARRRDHFFALHTPAALHLLLERLPGVQEFGNPGILAAGRSGVRTGLRPAGDATS